jgi:hypothetical protein
MYFDVIHFFIHGNYLWAQSTFDPPTSPIEIRVDKATEKISIDGVLDEASWKNTKPLYRI